MSELVYVYVCKKERERQRQREKKKMIASIRKVSGVAVAKGAV